MQSFLNFGFALSGFMKLKAWILVVNNLAICKKFRFVRLMFGLFLVELFSQKTAHTK